MMLLQVYKKRREEKRREVDFEIDFIQSIGAGNYYYYYYFTRVLLLIVRSMLTYSFCTNKYRTLHHL